MSFVGDEEEKVGVRNIVKKYLSLFTAYDESKNPQILILSGTTGRVLGRSRITEIVEALRDGGIDGITGEKKEDPFDNEWGLAFKSLLALLVKGPSSMTMAAWISATAPALMTKVNGYLEEEERRGKQANLLAAVLDLKTSVKGIEGLLSDIDSLREEVKGEKFNPETLTDFISPGLSGRDEACLLVDKIWQECRADNGTRDNNLEDDRGESSKGRRFLGSLTTYLTEHIKKPEIGRIHATTYRKAKGLEADLVIVTSVDSSEFFRQPQKRRLLYVAATRSKKNLILTFATKRSGARRYTIGRPEESRGIPRVYRSLLIPPHYPTQQYCEEWLNSWQPI